jgi:hypothetical protein
MAFVVEEVGEEDQRQKGKVFGHEGSRRCDFFFLETYIEKKNAGVCLRISFVFYFCLGAGRHENLGTKYINLARAFSVAES